MVTWLLSFILLFCFSICHLNNIDNNNVATTKRKARKVGILFFDYLPETFPAQSITRFPLSRGPYDVQEGKLAVDRKPRLERMIFPSCKGQQ